MEAFEQAVLEGFVLGSVSLDGRLALGFIVRERREDPFVALAAVIFAVCYLFFKRGDGFSHGHCGFDMDILM